MVLTKVILTIIIVTVLSVVAERVSPRAAGILSGYPLGSAIALFFIGLEQGPAYAGASAPYTLAGLAASLGFFFIYYLVSEKMQYARRALVIPAAGFAALLTFFTASYLLQAAQIPAWGGLLVAAAAILGFGLLFRRIPNVGIGQRVHFGLGVLLFRALLAALVLLAITSAAHVVPPRWAGLFSAFPAVLFPLVLIIHITYGPEQAHTVIKNFPTGLWSLVFYVLTVAFLYPRIGIGWGTLAGFAVATVYLLALTVLDQYSRNRKNSAA